MRMKRFENNLRKEIFKVSLLILIPILLITGLLIVTYNNSVREERLDIELSNYQNRVQSLLEGQSEELISKNRDLLGKYLSNEEPIGKVYQVVYSFNASQNIKNNVLLLNDMKQVVFTTDATILHDQAYLTYLTIVIENMEANESNYEEKVFKRLSGETLLNLIYPIEKDGNTIGYALSTINGDELSKIKNEAYGGYAIYDSFNNVLSASTDKFTHPITGKFLKENLINPPDDIAEAYAYKTSSITPGLTLIVYELDEFYSSLLVRSLLILIIIGFLIVVQTLYFSNKISSNTGESLSLLVNEMKKVQQNQDYRVSIETNDEFENLGESINEMLQKLSDTHEDNLLLSQLNLEAQRKKLEAQFNPHFLANTLETIRTSLYFNPELADKLIVDVNKLMRYSIDDTKEATLEDDQVYLEHFLSIHKERYDDFDYEFRIDERLNDLVIPKLFILPLIENSLKYGFQKQGYLKIIIEAKIIKKDIVNIKVKDNARAISREKYEQLNRNLKIHGKMGNHHGLKNSKNRLEFMYPASTFEIYTDEQYTVVEINILGAKKNVSDINRRRRENHT